MPLATIDTKTALIVVDLQKGIVNLPSIQPISGVIERSSAFPSSRRNRYNPRGYQPAGKKEL
jgi:hypothetical protein